MIILILWTSLDTFPPNTLIFDCAEDPVAAQTACKVRLNSAGETSASSSAPAMGPMKDPVQMRRTPDPQLPNNHLDESTLDLPNYTD